MNDDTRSTGDDLDRSASAAGHALDATDPAESAAVEEALTRSPEGRDELDAFRETAALLGLAVDPVEPSAGSRDDLMAKVALTPQEDPEPVAVVPALVDSVPLSPADPRLAPAAADPDEVGPDAARAGSTGSPAAERARVRWFRRPGVLVAGIAAAAALFVGGGVVGATVGSSMSDSGTISASAQDLAAITSASDSQSTKTTLPDGSTATVVWSPSLQRSAVLVDGLSELPSDQTYEAWYINADSVVAAGTFDASGGTTWHVLDGAMAEGDAIGVTVEPAGGSEQPTTVPIMVVESA